MIVVDVGNTYIHFAWEREGEIIKTKRVATCYVDEQTLKDIIYHYKSDKILISSVVPKITAIFKNIKKFFLRDKITIYIAGEDVVVPIKSYYNKKQVGMDRLVGVFAAHILYPRSRMVIDLGTAITIDFLAKNGDYMGGFILPGIESSLKDLSSCALLPKKIALKKIKTSFIPTNTKESINRGIQEGFSLMLNSFASEYKKILNFHLSSMNPIIFTGGNSPDILPLFRFPYIYDRFLVLKGLVILGNKS